MQKQMTPTPRGLCQTCRVFHYNDSKVLLQGVNMRMSVIYIASEDAASHAGDAYSSLTPGLTSGFQP